MGRMGVGGERGLTKHLGDWDADADGARHGAQVNMNEVLKSGAGRRCCCE